ncbi:multidrug efflux MFS transporter [Salinicola corii]|uniref:Multidrug efflux MFS transporter n=1 Tax=Salinicola corii TaxID=2606937 RepID=A0A640WA99_9GAMM|nr:MFS transporter [Salinicola corii]KAA0016964.1 multidrug efflux MFS transporter [Salinicola corii]
MITPVSRVMSVVLLGAGLVSLSNSMLNPALPAFMRAFEIGAGRAGGVVSVFMVAMVVAMPLTGYLGQRFGARRLYLGGILLFCLGSAVGALAASFVGVLAARALQGAASGLVIPLSLPLLFSVVPRERRGRISGTWAGVVMLVPAVGPLCGALVLQSLDWRWLFALNLPLGALAWGLAAICLPDAPKAAPRRAFDGVGYAGIAGAVVLAMAAGEAFAHGWLRVASLGLMLALVAGWAFVRWERRHPEPLLDLSILTRRDYRLGVIISVLQSINMFGCLVLVPLWVQVVMGQSPLWTGVALLCTALCAAAGGRLGGIWLDRRGPFPMIPVGLALSAVATLALGQVVGELSIVAFCALMALRGLGIGFSYLPATTIALGALPDDITTQGAAVNNMARRVSASLAIVAVSFAIDAMPERHLPLDHTLSILFLVVGLSSLAALPFAWRLRACTSEPDPSRRMS